MIRLPDWEPRLAAYLENVRDKPFAWGTHDCALHSANAVLAMTGTDFAAPFRGHYATELGSARALRRHGAGTLEATIDTMFPVIGRAFAQRGDLVLREGMLGICIGGDAVFVGEIGGYSGLVSFPRREWEKVWAVR